MGLAVGLIIGGPGLSLGIWGTEHGTGHVGFWPHAGEIAGLALVALAIFLAVAVVRGWWLPGGFREDTPTPAQVTTPTQDPAEPTKSIPPSPPPVLESRLVPWPGRSDERHHRLEVRIKSHLPLATILVNVPGGVGFGVMSFLLQYPPPGQRREIRPLEWVPMGGVQLSDSATGTVMATAKCRDEYGHVWPYVEVPISLDSA